MKAIAKRFYVSPDGNDAWSGRLPDPVDNDGPFATLARARDAMRALPQDGRPVRIELRGGVYELAETLVFTPEDSGTANAPITYAAYPGEHPMISGGRTLTGWQVGEVNGKTCWMTTLPDVAAGAWHFTQLFVNGERRSRSRLPKQGYYRFTGLPDGHRLFDWYGPTQRAEYALGDIQHWHNLEDVKLVALQHWFETHLHIKELDEARRIVTFTSRCISDLSDESNLLARYYLENVAEALTEPGEWYLDRKTGVLTYLPLMGETPETATVVAPTLDFLMLLLGSTGDGDKVRHLRFENLDFRYAEWNLPKENPGAVQAAFNVPGAIHLRGAEECALYGCTISRINQYAIEVQKGSYHNRIIACAMHDLGAGGVKIGHEGWEGAHEQATSGFWGLDPAALGWGALGDRELLPGRDPARGMYTTVADCHIHDGGKVYHSAVGIWVGNSGHNALLHNEIHDLYYSAISVGWNWHFAPTYTVGNRIEYNHIYNIGCGMLSDMGAIYALGLQPGGVMRGNHIHDVSCYGYGGCGIYPDQGSSFWLIEENVVHHTQTSPFSMHYGRDMLLRNNVFALSETEGIARGRQESVRAITAERNIVYLQHGEMVGQGWSNGTARFRNNLYWREGGLPLWFNGQPMVDWQAAGQEAGSVIADPLFVDPDGGDFTLRGDSPALALGFRPIDLSNVGPRYTATRPVTIDDLPPVVDAASPIIEPRLEIGAPTFPTLKDQVRLTHNPSMVFMPTGEPVTVSLTLENRGIVPVRGAVRLALTPDHVGRIIGAETCHYDLPPGERVVASFQVEMSPDAERMIIETCPQGDGLPASAQYVSRKQDLCIPRLSAATPFSTLADLLTRQTPYTVKVGSMPLAEVRMAIVGDALAIAARVTDRAIAPNPSAPWGGSCFEVFTPGTGECGKHRQFFLLPGSPGAPAQAMEMSLITAQISAVPTIQVQSTSWVDGYDLVALLPLAVLAYPTDARQFECELYVNTTPTPAGGRVNAKMFGALNNGVMGMDGWGTVHVAE